MDTAAKQYAAARPLGLAAVGGHRIARRGPSDYAVGDGKFVPFLAPAG